LQAALDRGVLTVAGAVSPPLSETPMKHALSVLVSSVLAVVAVSPSFATTRVGVFAIIDEVTIEPAPELPERIWLSGVFVIPVPVSSGQHRPPVRGHLYFSLNPQMPEATKQDWRALAAAAGTGRIVGFGEYWVPSPDERGGITNSSLEVNVHDVKGTAAPQAYPAANQDGVVTRFDTDWDICPRFGASSSEIIGALRAAHARYAPGGTAQADDAEIPTCRELTGLIGSSELESAYASQTRDPDWSGAAEAAILDRIAKAPELRLSDLLVECRETICRMHFGFPDVEYQEANGNNLVGTAVSEMPGFAQGGQIILPHDGTATLDFYIQRQP
jgi:hypothetical protein